jgi:DtxR family transcriptional regulator, Mn-dependent transcriptional regulator
VQIGEPDMWLTVSWVEVGVCALVDPLAALLIGLVGLGILVVVFWPGWGIQARRERSRELRARVHQEDALKHFYKAELAGRRPTLLSLAGTLESSQGRAAEVIASLQRAELAQVLGSEMHLTPAGRRYALSVIRAHRLWEQHLAERTGVAESEWHQLADRQEHFISPEQADALSAGLGHPAYDPHGDPIPTATGDLGPGEGRALGTLGVNEWGQVWHVEDEPEWVYEQIRAVGLYPGTWVRLLESSDRRVCVWANGEEHVLAPVVAANVTVRPAPAAVVEVEENSVPLSTLRVGQSCLVTRLSRQCRGAERRRLLDFGLLPGTEVQVEMESPAGSLAAYRVRETLIALRREQAAAIQVRPLGEGVR